MSSTIEQIYSQTTGTDTTALTAADGESYLYESQVQLIDTLSSAVSQGHDVFSPNFYYNAMTTHAIAEANPNLFNVSAEDAVGLGAQLQSDSTSQLLNSMTTSSSSSGLNILGSLYASNGMVSYLQTSPTYTFQTLA